MAEHVSVTDIKYEINAAYQKLYRWYSSWI